MRAAAEFHPGAKVPPVAGKGNKENEAGKFHEFAKRGGTAEVDVYRFRPQKEINLYGTK